MEAANCNYKIPQTNEILAYRETSTFRKYTVYYLDGEVDEITGSDSRSVSEIPSEKRLNTAGMDQDGILTIIDVTRILWYILK